LKPKPSRVLIGSAIEDATSRATIGGDGDDGKSSGRSVTVWNGGAAPVLEAQTSVVPHMVRGARVAAGKDSAAVVGSKDSEPMDTAALAASTEAGAEIEMVVDDDVVLRMMTALMVDIGSGGHMAHPTALTNYSIEWNDVTVHEDGVAEEAMAITHKNVTEKFDTACSRTISGVSGRIQVTDVGHHIVIKGFNNAQSVVDQVGINSDGVTEYYVSGMPRDLVLLSAVDYVRDGAAVLFPEDGVVLSLTDEEERQLREFVRELPVRKRLRVRNHTYEVDDGVVERAFASTNYFNTRVNVTTKAERVLVYLLTGMTLRDLQKAVKDGSVTGFHPELDSQTLSNFERKYGRTPDVLHLALPNQIGNVKGYLTEPRVYTRCGELVEMDNMESDFLEGDTADDVASPDKNLTIRRYRKKLPTHGGAIAANVSYDVYSGYVHGRLLKSTAKSVESVRTVVDVYATAQHPIAEFAADRGILHLGKFKVSTPEVVAFLQQKHIAFHGAEPNNHSNGTPHVERIIGVIKEKMRMAVQYILRNPNRKYLGFTVQQIMQLWGELFYWAVTVINLKECPSVPGKTRYEVFTGQKPNIQEIRLLPIFAVLMVLREEPNAAAVDGANRRFFQYGLYVGPDTLVSGAIRVAVVTNKRVQIVTSTKYKCVTDGGLLSPHPEVQRGLRRLLEEEAAVEDTGAGLVPDQHHDAVVPPANTTLPVAMPGPTATTPVPTTIVQTTPTPDESAAEVGGDTTAADGETQQEQEPTTATGTGKSKKRNRKPRVRRELDRASWPTREQRFVARQRAHAMYAKEEYSAFFAEDCPDGVMRDSRVLYNACFADWSTVSSGGYYYSFMDAAFYAVTEEDSVITKLLETGYRAVTKGVPKTFMDALKDNEWGEPARKEWNTMMETKAIVEVNAEAAQKAIADGADLVVLFPVYEEKEKEGQLVKKVRLVGDGRTHYGATNTYAGTPGRDEILVLLHIIAAKGWDFIHLDEVRAFLNADKASESEIYAKLKGGAVYYLILKALYGLRSSPRDYQQVVEKRMKELGFVPVILSPQLHVFKCTTTGVVVISLAFVDDFVMTGNCAATVRRFADGMSKMANFTKPILNPEKVLGLRLQYNQEARVMCVSMPDRIEELAREHGCTEGRVRHVPIPQSGYLVREYEFDELPRGDGELLGPKDINKYMQIVGSLIWLTVVRLDIVFATTYLAWFTKAPRKHHLNMALYVVSYLYHSKELPLVLGGDEVIQARAASDGSYGTGPKGRSISGLFVRLGSKAGGVIAKSTAAHTVSLSSFEAELDAYSRAVKVMRFLYNLLYSLGIEQERPVIECDNKAMIGFAQGEGVAKGARHMELRMWYVREQYKMRNYDLVYKSGKVLAADKFTKLGDRLDHQAFVHDVQGLGLLPSQGQNNEKREETT
jgi:hypothetical protein